MESLNVGTIIIDHVVIPNPSNPLLAGGIKLVREPWGGRVARRRPRPPNTRLIGIEVPV